MIEMETIYTDFKELSKEEILSYQNIFERYNINGFLTEGGLKEMMVQSKVPYTHDGLQSIMAEFDVDNDGKLNFREFLAIYKKAKDENEGMVDETRNGTNEHAQKKVCGIDSWKITTKIIKKIQKYCSGIQF
ncbi:EF-hand domain-containing protein D2 homolog [Contarinia nasturtii]|uniref:EF-hand domain-containing protein D2 homolog n=1 Tax=Contarinia nasturtii TaxID=265458 RepID=UPI0012D4B616|nr:EF-hand domain-containing protein D2 homolog [Contarinia nasturtii]